MWLPGRLEIVELGPQPDRIVTLAELPPLSTLSPPYDPPALPCQAGVALSGGDCEQVSLSFSG
jgi:hypothetical protein